LGAIIQVANLLSMFMAGTLATLVGVRNVFVMGGVLAIVAGFLAAAVFRGFKPPVAGVEDAAQTPVAA
jgi:MFS-type transporter involved in bile tolerance (Atg22 family)